MWITASDSAATSRGIPTKLTRLSPMYLRVGIAKEWIDQLEGENRQRLALGMSSGLTDHILIGPANLFHTGGYKPIVSANGNISFSARTDPRLIQLLFPTQYSGIFIPRSVKLHVTSTGKRAIAFEWPAGEEFIRSRFELEANCTGNETNECPNPRQAIPDEPPGLGNLSLLLNNESTANSATESISDGL